ncbi:MAG: transglycosylase domain-containing protein, partial [Chitinophagaceae bacterium]
MKTFIKWLMIVLWVGTFLSIIAIVIILMLANAGKLGHMPSLYDIKNPKSVLGSEIYSSDGVLLGKLYRTEDRIKVNYNDIAPAVISALVATEDERFFSHSGVDGRSLLRAIFSFGTAGGGSTITQQLAKNLFTKGSSNKLIRMTQKIKEWIIAVKLERNLSKEEILTLYLNTVPFGDNIYGIKNASNTFFQKLPQSLTIEESAVLVGMLKATSHFNPRTNPEGAFQRRNIVLGQMYRNSYIDHSTFQKLSNRPLQLNYRKLDENAGLAPYFREIVRNYVHIWCQKNKKPNGEHWDIYKDGLKIYTTINAKMQGYAEDAVKEHLSVLQRSFNRSNASNIFKERNKDSILNIWMKNSDRWKNMKNMGFSEDEINQSFSEPISMSVFAWNNYGSTDTVMTPLDSIVYHKKFFQVGFLVMDPYTGFVKVWVGGNNFKKFKYDHVSIKTKRQVGSTIKPLLYAAAIEHAGFNPETQCENRRQCFPEYDNWCSTNNNPKDSVGFRTVAQGLAFSINNVSVYILKHLGLSEFVNFLKKAQVRSKVLPVPSIAMGTPDISVYEMVRCFSMFPNMGIESDPVFVVRIEDKQGRVLFANSSKRVSVISE